MTSQVQTNPTQSQQENTLIALPKVSGPDGYLFAMAEMLAGVYSSTQKGSTANNKQQQAAEMRALLEKQMGEIHSYDELKSWVENLMKFDKHFSPEIQNFLNNVNTQILKYPGMVKGGPGTAAYNGAANQYNDFASSLAYFEKCLTRAQSALSGYQAYLKKTFTDKGEKIPAYAANHLIYLKSRVTYWNKNITKTQAGMAHDLGAMHAAVVEAQSTYIEAAESSAKANGTAADRILTGCKTFTSAAEETQKSYQSAVDAIGTLIVPNS